MYKELRPHPGVFAGPRLQYLSKFLEAIFAAIDLFRPCCAHLMLLLLTERLSQYFFVNKIETEHARPLRSHHLRSSCANRGRSIYCARCSQPCRFRFSGKILLASVDGEYLAPDFFVLVLSLPIDLFTKNQANK